MENASKALLIAGEVLIAILLVSLLLFALGKFSDYKKEKTKLEDIENTAKFNEQFANYNRNDVQGYELISLINQIVDYNERKTSDSNTNQDSYDPIKIQIDFVKEDNIKKDLTKDGTIRLFDLKPPLYKEDAFTAKNRNSRQSFIYNVTNKIYEELSKLNVQDQKKAEQIAKNIDYIFLTEEEIKSKAKNNYNGNENLVLKDMANNFNKSAGLKSGDIGYIERPSDARDKLVISGSDTSNNKYYSYALHFYEFMQFKRSVFKCVKADYNTITGRISEMDFEYVKIK